MRLSNYKSDVHTASVIYSASSSQQNYLEPAVQESLTINKDGVSQVNINKLLTANSNDKNMNINTSDAMHEDNQIKVKQSNI